MKTGRPTIVEHIHYDKAGNKEYFEIHAYPIFDNEGNIGQIIEYSLNITERVLAKEKLYLNKQELEQTNITLEVLLKKINNAQREIEGRILSNINSLILPHLEQLETSLSTSKEKSYLQIVKADLADIISKFSRKLLSKDIGLTPKEIQIADLIRRGKTSKEIAVFLNLSQRTIEFHRDNIRKKVGLTNKKISLRSYLQKLS